MKLTGEDIGKWFKKQHWTQPAQLIAIHKRYAWFDFLDSSPHSVYLEGDFVQIPAPSEEKT